MNETQTCHFHARPRPPTEPPTQHSPPPPAAIDLCTALYLLAIAVDRWRDDFRGETAAGGFRASHETPDSLVAEVLSLAGVGAREVEGMRGHRLRELFAQGRLPVTMTLGAVAVLDAAEQGMDGRDAGPWVLERASTAAVRFLDLLPDLAFEPGDGHFPNPRGRIRLGAR
jgi:hypothetical protein